MLVAIAILLNAGADPNIASLLNAWHNDTIGHSLLNAWHNNTIGHSLLNAWHNDTIGHS